MRFSFLVPVLASAVALAACSSSSSPPAPVCVAGVTQACLCVGGGTGVQSCKDDSTGFGVCDCGGDTGPQDSTIDSPIDSSTDSTTTDDTKPSETAGETGVDAPTDSGTDSGGGKFTGATGTSWELRTGVYSGPQGFSEYTPAGVGYFFAAFSYGGGGPGPMMRYDIASDSWTSVVKNPWGVENYRGLAWSGTSLFVGNGNSLYRYTISSDSWTSVASGLPGTSSSMHAHDDAKKVYAMATDGTNKLVVFDTDSSTTSYATGPTGTVYQPRLAWDGTTKALYIAPSPDQIYLWSFAPATGTVTARASIPETSIGRAFCSDRSGHVYATADNSTCSTSSTIWQYDTVANTWKKIPDLPFAHGCNGACTVTDDGWLFVSDGAGRLARLKLL